MTTTEILLISLGFLLIIIATLLRSNIYYKRYKKARDFMKDSVKDLEEKIASYHNRYPNKDTEMEKARQAHYEYFMKEREALEKASKEKARKEEGRKEEDRKDDLGFDPSQN